MFFEVFVYLLIILEKERECSSQARSRGGRRGKESQVDSAPSEEPNAGLNLTTPRS